MCYVDVKDEFGMENTLYDIGIPIHKMSSEEMQKVASVLFEEDRFASKNVGEKTFCFFQDFDVLYSDFVAKYPSLNLTPEKFSNMDYYEFNMLLSGVFSTCKDRIQTRQQKEPKAPKGAKGEALKQHQEMIANIRKSKSGIKLSSSNALKYG